MITTRTIFIFTASLCIVYGMSNSEFRLRAKLFSNYNRVSKPLAKGPVEVEVGVAFTNLMSMDVQREEISINIWFRMRWVDGRLKWNSSEHGNVTQINVPVKDIWTPDVFLYFASGQVQEFGKNIKGSLQFTATLSHSGSISFSQPTTIHATCLASIPDYPFDDQFCTLIFGEWSQDLTTVDMVLFKDGSVDLANYVKHNEWEMLSINASTGIVPDIHSSAFGYSKIDFKLHLRRHALFYMVNYILPPTLIAILSLLVFLIPPEVGKRMEAGINLLLCLSVYLSLINSKMPITSKSFPLLTKFYGCTIVILVISLCCSCWVYSYYFMNPSGWAIHHIPGFLQVVLFDYLRPLLSCSLPCRKKKAIIKVAPYSQATNSSDQVNKTNDQIMKNGDPKDNGITQDRSDKPRKPRQRNLYVEVTEQRPREENVNSSEQEIIKPKKTQGIKVRDAQTTSNSKAGKGKTAAERTMVEPRFTKNNNGDDGYDDDDDDSGYCNTSDAAMCDKTNLEPPAPVSQTPHSAHLMFMAESARRNLQKVHNKEKWKSAAMILNKLFVVLLVLSIVCSFFGCFMSSVRVRMNLY